MAIKHATPDNHPMIPPRSFAAKEAQRPATTSLHQWGLKSLLVRFRVAREIGS